MHALSGINLTATLSDHWNLTKKEHYELFMGINLKECLIKMHFLANMEYLKDCRNN